jgi:hypothetical protein
MLAGNPRSGTIGSAMLTIRARDGANPIFKK